MRVRRVSVSVVRWQWLQDADERVTEVAFVGCVAQASWLCEEDDFKPVLRKARLRTGPTRRA